MIPYDPPTPGTPGEAAFRVWWTYCRNEDSDHLAAALWSIQMPVVVEVWERIAAAAIETAVARLLRPSPWKGRR